MSLHFIYFSATGRTKKTGELFIQAWGEPAQTWDLTTPASMQAGPAPVLGPQDICLVAMPVYEGRLPVPAAQRLAVLQGGGAIAIPMVVFGNRAFDDALRELADILTAHGFRCPAAVAAVAEHSILPQFGAGRPDAADAQELARYATTLRAALEAGTLPDQVTPPGNVPYVEMGGIPIHPKGNRKCVGCGLCAKECPVQAIPATNPRTTDGTKCITCMRCLDVCPTHARDFPAPLRMAATLMMKKALQGHKENTLYMG